MYYSHQGSQASFIEVFVNDKITVLEEFAVVEGCVFIVSTCVWSSSHTKINDHQGSNSRGIERTLAEVFPKFILSNSQNNASLSSLIVSNHVFLMRGCEGRVQEILGIVDFQDSFNAKQVAYWSLLENHNIASTEVRWKDGRKMEAWGDKRKTKGCVTERVTPWCHIRGAEPLEDSRRIQGIMNC